MITLLSLTSLALAAAPLNDDLSGAEDLGSVPFSVNADTSEATVGLDDESCVSTGATVWYTFTADEDGVVLLDTIGSTYDTTLTVFDGDFVQVGCNDDTFGVQSYVELAVTAGETYTIQVGAYGTLPGGAMVLNGAVYVAPTPPENDDFADATEVGALPFSDAVNTDGATEEPTDGDCAGAGPTVWYAYTATANTTLVVDTVGSDYDTTVSVWTADLDNVGCNDDAVGLQSRLRFDVTAGETYYVMVGSYNGGSSGNLEVHLGVAPPPLVASVSLSGGRWSSRTGAVTVSGTVTCSEAASIQLFGELDQRPGTRTAATGSFWADVYCTGSTTFTADVWTTSGRMISGPTEATVDVSAYAPASYERDTDTLDTTVQFTASSN